MPAALARCMNTLLSAVVVIAPSGVDPPRSFTNRAPRLCLCSRSHAIQSCSTNSARFESGTSNRPRPPAPLIGTRAYG